jgi:twitching motility protein PilT
MSEAGLSAYLQAMVDRAASDLYLRADARPRMRIGGVVRATDLPAPGDQAMRTFIAQVLTPVAAERFARSADVDAAYSHPGVGRFRINCFSQQGRPAMAVRLVPSGGVDFSALNLPDAILEMADAAQGLVLVVGPTGCGKSTTLAALIHHINRTRDQHIVTIEDPIEFVHDEDRCLIHQRQVGYDTESFATALRHVVRQSPDVILIGEMRDRDTMRTALSAALTGHLVFTTLHTASVAQSVDRILSYFPAESHHQAQVDLATTLVGIVSMRLLPVADGRPGEADRVPAVEILRSTPTVRRVITEGRLNELYDIMKRGADAGMRTLNQSLVELVKAGRIDETTAARATANADELRLNLQGMYTGIDSIALRGSLDEEKEQT